MPDDSAASFLQNTFAAKRHRRSYISASNHTLSHGSYMTLQRATCSYNFVSASIPTYALVGAFVAIIASTPYASTYRFTASVHSYIVLAALQRPRRPGQCCRRLIGVLPRNFNMTPSGLDGWIATCCYMKPAVDIGSSGSVARVSN